MDVARDEPERSEEKQQAAVSKSRRQVNTTDGHKCPICGQVYTAITQHLKFTEGVTNRTELDLLRKLAHRHFTANLDCPVRLCNAKHINRLDKHLQNIHKLEKPVVALYMQKAKDKLITRELALLRASEPTPPMVSHLDEVDDVAIEEGIRREMEASSQAASTEAFFATCLTIVSSSPDASQTPSEHTNPNMLKSISDSSSKAQNEHANLNMSSTSHYAIETFFADSTQNMHPPFHSASEAHSEHAILNMPSTSHSVMETPFAHSTSNTPPPSHSASKAPSEHAISDMPSPSGSKPNQLARIQRKRALLRTPSPGCRNCHLLFAELKVVKQLLQCEVERNHELRHLHASANQANLVKYKRRKSFSPSKAPQYVRLVEEFRGHIRGVNPSRKMQENAKQRATHVIHFLEFMADSRIPNVDLLFLKNHSRVRNFVAHLQEKGFKPTSQRLYLMDVVAFLKYILNMSPQSVRLGTKMINALLVELRARLRDIGRNVVGHQLSVRRSKSERLVDGKRHNAFIEMAPENIAAILDDLEKQPENRPTLRIFFGFLGGYIIATTGLRKGVVISMTAKEVETAEKTKNGGRIIRVEQHKTKRYFGQAAIPLNANEYAWFERYNKLRQYVDGGSEASTFFHNSRGGVLLKLDNYFKQAWEGLRLGIAPTFNMLRSSVATYVKWQLGHKMYRKVATFMCHDEHAAKIFYQAEDPAEEVQRSRYLSMLAISTCAAKEKKRERRKKGHDKLETVSSLEEEDGLEPVRKKLFQDHNNLADSEEKTEHRNYQLRKKNKSVQSKQETPVKSSKQLVSSTEDEGSDEWKPTQDSSEDDSEVSDEPVRTCVRKEGSHKKESVISPILQRQKQIESSSESDHLEEKEKKARRRITNVAKKRRVKKLVSSTEDVSGVGKSTPEYPESDSGGEEEQVREMVRKEAENSPVQQKEGKINLSPSAVYQQNTSLVKLNRVTLKKTEGRIAVKVRFGMQQVFVSPGTAKVLKSRSSKIEAYHQSSLFEFPSPISVLGNIKRQQVGSPSVQMCTSEAEIQKENVEMDGSEGEGREIKAEIQKEPLEMEGTEDQDGQGGEAEVQVEPLEEMSGFKCFWSDGLSEVLKEERSDIKLYLSDSDGEEHQ